MQRYEVEAIFEQKKDGLFEDINISSQKPIAIILGGQPACGKSTLINVAKKDHPNLDFLTVNGDLYRQFHPNKELIEGGNLAASKIRNLECPSYEICLIDYGCGKFNRKIHIMEQYP